VDDSEKLHLEAATYAHERMAKHTAGLIKLKQKPMTKLAHAGTWLAHYEGYKSGYQACSSNTESSTTKAS
jgi:hypothetical protein